MDSVECINIPRPRWLSHDIRMEKNVPVRRISDAKTSIVGIDGGVEALEVLRQAEIEHADC